MTTFTLFPAIFEDPETFSGFTVDTTTETADTTIYTADVTIRVGDPFVSRVVLTLHPTAFDDAGSFVTVHVPPGGTSRRRVRRASAGIGRRRQEPARITPPLRTDEAVRLLTAMAKRYAKQGVALDSFGFETHDMRQRDEDDAVAALLLGD